MTIKEFLPNPIGNDKDGEYILILNDGPSVSSDGWKIKDLSEKEFLLKGSLDVGQEIKLFYSQTKISLNNNGEKLFLYDANGNLADELGYSGQASEGQIITKRLATSEVATNQEAENGYPVNPQITKVFFLDFLTAGILASVGLYIVLQLEKKLNQPLF